MPCEILIKTNVHGDGTVNYTHPDSKKDKAGVYKKGYPVTIREYPHSGWGFKEGLPYFVLVRVTDAAVAEVEALINTNFSIPSITSPQVRTIEEVSLDGYTTKTNIVYRRQFRVSEATVDDIISKGIETHVLHSKGDVEYRHIEITLSQLVSYIINKIDEDV